jgi:hypothetical protein
MKTYNGLGESTLGLIEIFRKNNPSLTREPPKSIIDYMKDVE